jgi:hypothetical protein
VASDADGFEVLTASLIALMKSAAPGARVISEGPDGLQLVAPVANPLRPKEPMWFGGVRRGKAYVSYHLMPVYTHPALAATISPALKKRMQGKSCFNFKTADPALFEELAALTAEGARLYSTPLKAPTR